MASKTRPSWAGSKSASGFKKETVQRLVQPKIKRLGQNIARLRTQAGLSQERLAELAEIHTRFLQKMEGGKLGASLAVLIRLKKALKSSWDDLLAGVG